MDSFEGRCRLDWWANSSTLLGSIEVDVVITDADEGNWAAHGCLVSDNDEDRDDFAFLCNLDPVFMLRFADENMFDVIVNPAEGHHRFTLRRYTGPSERSFDYRIEL
ncbi:hypothetical protein [Polymorphospora rubra]|uniref:Uncharacterized protein n=1 Tax=Polymorphospora rubra TaxID=338584 RepID=A0A810N5V6_9ACTN|nr:hypothetical protein [Polymorphospora rubra]BCJ67569.1 hypothetical protein Prubr_45900 [Polymorphospora rubra]